MAAVSAASTQLPGRSVPGSGHELPSRLLRPLATGGNTKGMACRQIPVIMKHTLYAQSNERGATFQQAPVIFQDTLERIRTTKVPVCPFGGLLSFLNTCFRLVVSTPSVCPASLRTIPVTFRMIRKKLVQLSKRKPFVQYKSIHGRSCECTL